MASLFEFDKDNENSEALSLENLTKTRLELESCEFLLKAIKTEYPVGGKRLDTQTLGTFDPKLYHTLREAIRLVERYKEVIDEIYGSLEISIYDDNYYAYKNINDLLDYIEEGK